MSKLKNLRTIIFCLVLFMIAGCQNPDRYTVTFDANGGKFKDNSTVKYMKWSNYHSGDASVCPNEFTFKLVCGNYPKREGYFFVDWTSNQDGTGFSYTPTGLSPSDYTFYAQWHTEDRRYDGQYGYIVTVKKDKFAEAIARGADGHAGNCIENECFVTVMDETLVQQLIADGIAISYEESRIYSFQPPEPEVIP